MKEKLTVINERKTNNIYRPVTHCEVRFREYYMLI